VHGSVTAGASLATGGLPALQQRSLHAAQATSIAESRQSGGDWIAYGREPGGMRHSPLAQITRQNVEHLTVAWTYHTGELASYEGMALAGSAAFEATPLMGDGALYFSTPSNRVIALDAATGAERWVFDPGVDLTRDYSEATSRGVSTWADPDKSPTDPGYRRLFLGTLDGRLLALDADSGQPSPGFGQQGAVDLTADVNLLDPGNYLVTSPPAIIGDLVVVGSAIGDNRAVESERGIVRAFAARSGELRWSWDPIPRNPGDPGYDTWTGPVAQKTGGATKR
jgi:quinoprotein glucose dehydrogenase